MLERGTPSEYVSYIILTTHKKFHALDQPVTIFFPFYLTTDSSDKLGPVSESFQTK